DVDPRASAFESRGDLAQGLLAVDQHLQIAPLTRGRLAAHPERPVLGRVQLRSAAEARQPAVVMGHHALLDGVADQIVDACERTRQAQDSPVRWKRVMAGSYPPSLPPDGRRPRPSRDGALLPPLRKSPPSWR